MSVTEISIAFSTSSVGRDMVLTGPQERNIHQTTESSGLLEVAVHIMALLSLESSPKYAWPQGGGLVSSFC